MTLKSILRLGAALTAIAFGPAVQAAEPFSFETVVAQARTLAESSYAPPAEIPESLAKLRYEQYQSIRFRPSQSLWANEGSRFQTMLFHPGLFYRHPVEILTVEGGEARPLAFDKSLFEYPPRLAEQIPNDLGYAGLVLTYPLHRADEQNQVLVFAGASYFRGVGSVNAWGLSGRGLALDTGLSGGEEFPNFRRFWLEKPAPGADTMVVNALLDSRSVTGAYRFVVRPGATLELEVQAVLFFRKEVGLLGVAPLTSMFFYGENSNRPAGNWRPEVHDSDGLSIHAGSGERIWRPVANPKRLQMSYFSVASPKGFGLLQRDEQFANYQDLEAHYQRRPSAWVSPRGDWGAGEVVLVEIPTGDETNDNIVAFWRPAEAPKPGQRLDFAYDMRVGVASIAQPPGGRGEATYVGAGDLIGGGDVAGSVRILADFNHGPLAGLAANAPVSAVVNLSPGAELIHQSVVPVPDTGAWRLSILARPAKNEALEARAFLKQGEDTLTETWTYRYTEHLK